MKRIGRYIASYGSALLVSLFGIVLGMTLPSTTSLKLTLAIFALCPLVLLLLNLLLAKRYVNRINQTKVADMHGYMLRHRNEAEETSAKMLKKIQRLRHWTTVYSLIVWLLAACAAVLGGMLYLVQTWLFWLCLLYSGTVFYAVYSRIFKEERIVLNDDTVYLSKEDYPTVHSLASRAAKQLSCREEIVIVLPFNCTASIVKDKDRYLLQIGVILLHILSEEELYAIFLHEFSHVSDSRRAAIRETKYHAAISNQSAYHTRWLSFVVNLFVFLDIRYLFDFMVYQYATSVVKETEADRDMARYGNVEAAASALLKLEYDTRYFWESGVRNESPIYESESPEPNYLTAMITRFKQAIAERHSDWDAMVSREILANNATHPTLRMRLETLGVSEVKTIEDHSSQAYCEELQKALDHAEQIVYKDRKASYAKDRKEAYLDPLERVTAWEQSGSPITAEHYADIISDLKQLGRHEDAEMLCERAMQELPETSSVHAYFMKGSAMLYRYDERGMDLIYHAMEKIRITLKKG